MRAVPGVRCRSSTRTICCMTRVSVRQLAHSTPDSRDRTVDLVRGVSILVVVLWHGVASLGHWRDGRLAMPNPLSSVPGGWLLTWFGQVMPLFFLAGGYANAVALALLPPAGRPPARVFIAARLRRIAQPVAAMLAVWALGDVIARTLFGAVSVWQWGRPLFTPLWFLGAYAAVVAAAPWTLRAFERWGWRSVAALGALTVVLDLARFVAGIAAAGLLNSLAVFLFAHQLGYLWRAEAMAEPQTAPLVHGQRRRRSPGAVLALLGVGGMALATTIGGLPRSMVAEVGESNMFPTTSAITFLACAQAGLVLSSRPLLRRLAARPAVWQATVAVNAVAMTVFSWHMTACVALWGAWRGLAGSLPVEPSVGWWLTRPLWAVALFTALVPLVALFAAIERHSRSAQRARPGARGERQPGPDA